MDAGASAGDTTRTQADAAKPLADALDNPRAHSYSLAMAELSAEQIRSIFDHYDRDRNGYIDASEWTHFLGVLDPTLSPQEAQAGLLAVDKNHNGRVEFKEFLNWWFSR